MREKTTKRKTRSKGRRDKKLTIYLSDREFESLNLLSDSIELTYSALVRQLILREARKYKNR